MKKIYYIILIIVLPSCDPIDNFDYSHIQYDYKVLKYDGKDFLSDWGINVPNYPLTYAYMNYEADMIISGVAPTIFCSPRTFEILLQNAFG